MNNCCFLCNTFTNSFMKNAINIFGHPNTLPSGKTLLEVVSEIIDKPLKEDAVHSKLLCTKCFKSVFEYDNTAVDLRAMKMAMVNQFKISLSKSNLNYDTYEADIKSKVPVKSCNSDKKMGKIVLPASKLQPLTPDLLLKVSKLAAATKSNFVLDQNKSPPVITINNTMISQQETTQSQKTDILTTLANSLNENVITSSSSDMKTLSFNSLTKELLSNDVDLEKDVNDDDDTMEIDEDCALSVVPVTSSNGDLVLEVQGVKRPSKSSDSQLIDVSVLQSLDSGSSGGDDDKYILGKLQIMNDGDDDDEHTIVLDGDNGSILRMVSGQRLVLDGGELALVPDHQSATDHHPDHDQGDSQDSNDEPQIELQVSGDEETANAIIAAAQEQGCAFIKVESGEMYRVKSVQSKNENTSSRAALSMVERVDGKFRCLLCENKNHGTLGSATPAVGEAEWMMRHLRHLHDARLYICRLCGDTYRRRADYTSHMAVHSKKLGVGPTPRAARGDEARIHTCRSCGKTFASKYTLIAHQKTHSDRPRPYKCKQCSKSFLTQQNLNQHEKTHSGIKDFICNICNKAFSTQHNLEVHGVVHSGARPFACGACGKGFARRAELRDHLRTHTGERPFACETCGATFSQRSNLHSHRRATHLNEKRHACSLCPKQFKRRRLLDYHVKASHTGERPLKCEVCSSTFVYPEHYKKHIRTHSGERPYVCEICGKTFTTRDNRNTHRFVHSDKKPYECLACGAGFMRKHLLYEHMNHSGHIAESIVVNQPRVTKVATNMFGTDELELDSTEDKSIIGKNPLSLPDDDPLIIQALTGDRSEATLLEAVDVSQLENAEIVDENGEMIRLIQVKLPSGDNGWMAVNN
ncbi:PR domain zinc finger protein 5 isoform X1 [Manduca sexta]|uniref:PR domain zinc finger protein 5 isoform X1 n=1 Tax=Manduca sexta TaxID=7130 RepID=UPI00188EEA2A|nr:PR domain zinc finger protein 5 isoform X1 [Manduca sexta]XP_037293124.1 PR domain zinc finger protein 5 isoform X2 [Manduca sexta]XP_037293130.1 PR domain zinc finger protein 5 isoform X1 [Manduca sexta]